MKNIILDTSVILKLILNKDEGDLDKVKNILEDYLNGIFKIMVPDLFYYEFLNVLKFKFKNLDTIIEASLLIKNLNFENVNLTGNIEKKALKLCMKYKKISFYDASFHAVAILNDGFFITSDEKYYNIVKKEGHILLLKDYKHCLL